MQITTLSEARSLVGRTFERDGKRRSVVNQWRLTVPPMVEWGVIRGTSVVLTVESLQVFSDWLSGATEVTE